MGGEPPNSSLSRRHRATLSASSNQVFGLSRQCPRSRSVAGMLWRLCFARPRNQAHAEPQTIFFRSVAAARPSVRAVSGCSLFASSGRFDRGASCVAALIFRPPRLSIIANGVGSAAGRRARGRTNAKANPITWPFVHFVGFRRWWVILLRGQFSTETVKPLRHFIAAFPLDWRRYAVAR